jgi:hypothetical protein
MLFQRGIFHENDNEHIKILEKYFRVHEIGSDHLTERDSEGQFFAYRCSIANAKKNRVFEKFTNCLEWAGKLRNEMVNPKFHFQTLDEILEDWPIAEHGYSDVEGNFDTRVKYFVRPVSGDKLFAGNVYDYKTLKNEFDHLLQRNVDPHVLCMISKPVSIEQEYRTIFVDGKYVSGSQYIIFKSKFQYKTVQLA